MYVSGMVIGLGFVFIAIMMYLFPLEKKRVYYLSWDKNATEKDFKILSLFHLGIGTMGIVYSLFN